MDAISSAVALLGQQRQDRQQGLQNINQSIQTMGSLGKARKMKKAGKAFMTMMEKGISMEEAVKKTSVAFHLNNEEAKEMVITAQTFHERYDIDTLRRIDKEIVEEGSALAKRGTNLGIDLVGRTKAEARHIIKINDPGKHEIVTGKGGRQQAWYPGQDKEAPEGTSSDETYRAGMDGILGKKYKPENVTLWKNGKSKVINKNNAEAMQKALDEGFEEEGKEFAKDMVQYRNRKDNKVINVNINDPKAIAKARKDGFTPMGPSEKTFLEESGKAGSKKLTEFNDDYGRAQEQIATLNLASHYLSQFESGRMAPTTETVLGWAEALGVTTTKKDKKLGAMQAFNAIAERMVLQSRNLGPGQVLAGQMSDRDVEFLRNMNIGLMKSPEGNKQLIEVLTKLATRRMEIANAANEFTEMNGGVFNASKFRTYCKEQGFDKKHMFDDLTSSEESEKQQSKGLNAWMPKKPTAPMPFKPRKSKKVGNYNTAEEIRAAMRRGEISKEEAMFRHSQLR